MKSIPNELAPCGVYCGACPSFNKTCLGCVSANKKQKRKSKWECKIRVCCYDIEKLYFCIDCGKFPCITHRKKLSDTHQGDSKFKYRHEIPQIFAKMKEMDIESYLEYQKKRWICPSCGGVVYFYHYKCSNCGKEVPV